MAFLFGCAQGEPRRSKRFARLRILVPKAGPGQVFARFRILDQKYSSQEAFGLVSGHTKKVADGAWDL